MVNCYLYTFELYDLFLLSSVPSVLFTANKKLSGAHLENEYKLIKATVNLCTMEFNTI